MDIAYQKVRQELNNRIGKMSREGAPKEDIEKLKDEAEALARQNATEISDYLAKSRFVGVVGAFEGAGYSSTGLYRPMLDCIMFSKGAKPFCKVCMHAIERMISYYSS